MSADPGCGKSVLASFLVDELNSRDSQAKLPGTVCYFFFKDDNDEQKSAILALCALLHQLFIAESPLIRHAMTEFDHKNQKFTEEFGTLWRILTTASTDSSRGHVIVILDGLDECGESTRALLIESLVKFYSDCGESGANGSFLKFLVTSRPYLWIENKFADLPKIRLRAEEETDATSKDIKLVVKARITKVGLVRHLPDITQARLVDHLVRNADRTFLWVSLILEMIEKSAKVSRKALDDIISAIPSTLDAVYDKILSQSTDISDARKILNIVVAAARPLSLEEINVAFTIMPSDHSYEDLSLEPSIGSTVKNICGLFIKIIDNKVYLVHQTAKEFLVRPSNEVVFSLGPWKYSLDPVESNHALAEICASYLLFSVFEIDPLIIGGGEKIQEKVERYTTEHVFLDYAAKHWATHFREAKELSILKSWLEVCDTRSKRFLTWFQVYWSAVNVDFQCPQNFTALIVGSYFGHEAILRLLLGHKADVKIKDNRGWTALHWAAENGHKAVVRLLLEHKADVDAEDDHGSTALHSAAGNGHEAVVRLLLEHKADVDARDYYGSTALHWAAENGDEAVVRLLLEHKADVDTEGDYGRDYYGSTALHWAAVNVREAVVRLLLEHKADVDAKDDYGSTALHRAAENGDEAVVRLLLEHKADVDAEDDDRSTALHRAARDGHEAVVRLLLEHKADVDAKDDDRSTALHWAAENGHEAVVRLLLEHKADVDAEDDYGSTALHSAAGNGREAVVRLLLEHKADVDVEDDDRSTALHWAAGNGHEAVVRLLLEHKADVDAEDDDRSTALHRAAGNGHEAVVRLLQSNTQYNL